MARPPTRQQRHPALEAVQVGTEGHAVAVQELQAGVAGHQTSQGIVGTACHGVHQLLGRLQERSQEEVPGAVGRDTPRPATALCLRPVSHKDSRDTAVS